MKRIIAIVLALVTVLGLCACGAKRGSSSGEELTADGRVKLTIGIPADALILDYNNNALTNWVEEKCGVELEFIEYAGGTDVPTQISTTIAARQTLPDMIYGVGLNDKTISTYGKEGYLLDLRPYFDDKEGASKVFWERFESDALTEEDRASIWRGLVEGGSDAIYAMPLIETTDVDCWHSKAWINKEWLDKINMPAPTNTDELLKVLRAFKSTDCNGNGIADELPMIGTTGKSPSADVLAWLVNLCTYYNMKRPWYLTEDKTVDFVYLTDAYREALQLINTLYKEGLLIDPWNTSSNDLKLMATPNDGVAIAGIFFGHLTNATVVNTPLINQYEYLPTWGYNTRREHSVFLRNCFITGDCAESKQAKAFEVMMATMSWDGSMRWRYGEYGINWADADEGITTAYGYEATFKLIEDVFNTPRTCSWKAAPVFNEMCEYETAQMADTLNPYQTTKLMMHVEMVKSCEENEAQKKPDNYLPPTKPTPEEDEATSVTRTNVNSRRTQAEYEFCTGVLDPYSDKDWNNYLNEMKDLGLEIYRDYLQVAYDREYK